MARGTADQTQAVKDRICREATRLFAERGFAATSISAIAEAAGVSKSLVLYHYAGKEALRDAVFDGLVAHWSTVLPEILAAVGDGASDPLERVIAGAVQVLRDDPWLARFLMRELLRPDGVKERLGERTMPATELAAAALSQLTGKPLPDDSDPAAALILMGLVLTAVVAVFPENEDGTRGRDGLGDRVLAQALLAVRATLPR